MVVLLVECEAVVEWMSCLAIQYVLHLDGCTSGSVWGGTCYKHPRLKDGLKDGGPMGSHPVAESELRTNYGA